MADEKKKRKWDLTSTGGVWSAADWIRKQGDALLVLVVRVDDMAFSVAPDLAPHDAIAMVQDELPSLLAMLKQQREEEKKGARAAGSRSGETAR